MVRNYTEAKLLADFRRLSAERQEAVAYFLVELLAIEKPNTAHAPARVIAFVKGPT